MHVKKFGALWPTATRHKNVLFIKTDKPIKPANSWYYVTGSPATSFYVILRTFPTFHTIMFRIISYWFRNRETPKLATRPVTRTFRKIMGWDPLQLHQWTLGNHQAQDGSTHCTNKVFYIPDETGCIVENLFFRLNSSHFKMTNAADSFLLDFWEFWNEIFCIVPLIEFLQNSASSIFDFLCYFSLLNLFLKAPVFYASQVASSAKFRLFDTL